MLSMIRATVVSTSRSVAMLVVAVAVLLAACGGAAAPGGGTQAPAGATQAPATAAGGGGGGGGGGGTAANFCQLINAADVAAIVGKTIATTEPGAKDCTWTFNDKNNSPVGGVVTIRTENNDGSLQGPKLGFPNGEDVGGIGDRAYWVDSFSVLYFVKGNTTYAVQLVLFNTTDPRKDIAGKVAQLALAKV